jgi:hypothetical protein
VTFIRVGIPYRKVGMGETIEYVVVEIWDQGKKYVIINFYNPCKRLGFNELEKIEGQDVERVIWCGDFNAHNTLWGGTVVDVNGQVVEELIDARKLVCLNDGGGTRVNINSGLESALDLTLVSGLLGGITEWEILRECTMGSDHYPLVITILGNGKEIGNKKGATGRWIYEKANWAEFSRECEEGLSMMEGMESNCIDETNKRISVIIKGAAEKYIPKSKGSRRSKMVPWWNEECNEAIKIKRKMFRKLKSTHNFQNLVNYKAAQAVVRRVVRKAKRDFWRSFCNEIGRSTPVEDIWNMIKKMRGISKEFELPVLKRGEELAVTDEEKAKMFREEFTKVNSSGNLCEERKRLREEMLKINPAVKDRSYGQCVGCSI